MSCENTKAFIGKTRLQEMLQFFGTRERESSVKKS